MPTAPCVTPASCPELPVHLLIPTSPKPSSKALSQFIIPFSWRNSFLLPREEGGRGWSSLALGSSPQPLCHCRSMLRAPHAPFNPCIPKPSSKAVVPAHPHPWPQASGRTWWSSMSSRVHFTLTSPGRFTWKPSVSWVVGIRCHCKGQQGHCSCQAMEATCQQGLWLQNWAGALGRLWHSHTAWGSS